MGAPHEQDGSALSHAATLIGRGNAVVRCFCQRSVGGTRPGDNASTTVTPPTGATDEVTGQVRGWGRTGRCGGPARHLLRVRFRPWWGAVPELSRSRFPSQDRHKNRTAVPRIITAMHEAFTRPISRRAVLSSLAAATAATPLLTGCSSSASSQGSSSTGSTRDFSALDFDATAGAEQSTTVSTDAGDVEVGYTQYDSIVYCLDPVDSTYQSLTVKVPTVLNGTAWDAGDAPIVVALNIGGYSSATASGGASGGGAPGRGSSDAPGGGTPPEGDSAPDVSGGGPGAGGVASGAGDTTGSDGQPVDNGELALAAGCVVVVPGARGRDAQSSDGTWIGKAPAQIVDLKAAIRWIHHNRGRLPGDTDHIITTGSSAGGALSALLGASGDSELYTSRLAELGAADASDAVFASAGYCPQTDIEHEDVIYEWTFGAQAYNGAAVDRTVSDELATGFGAYAAELNLEGVGDYGVLTADNYGDYLVTNHLAPAATDHLAALSDSERASYLSSNPWISWQDSRAGFGFADFLAHVGRSKPCPAVDQKDLASAENGLFGDETTDARHFTDFGLRLATGEDGATVDQDIPDKLTLMNPMHFLREANPGRARNWFIRVGTSDTDTSPVIVANLAAIATGLGDSVDALMYWDAGHGANRDAAAFISWIAERTGFAVYSA